MSSLEKRLDDINAQLSQEVKRGEITAADADQYFAESRDEMTRDHFLPH